MNLAEQALDTARSVFMAHKEKCNAGCRNFALHKTSTLSAMCLQGTQLYKALLKCEDAILKSEQAKKNAKESRAIRRENMKQVFS